MDALPAGGVEAGPGSLMPIDIGPGGLFARPGREGPGGAGPEDGPCLAPELVLGRPGTGVGRGGPVLVGRVGPGSGALP